ncbi:ribosome small subunit-dependent GTPase A [Raineyella fluvialis]|uniref:Small ribosomal subunit biogenesis GTPase RsgA n=1 Tax=Raineyella fluvialis TaxID=2662261 RepID=A0A5Q2FKP8_9ACTN|nr:ribosome small subunit-dependent GTPase A [Raineyella fluvialis]QGF25235.1 ribosome small subunit-dependent GTPase A [Raineyella fluvialis]
MSPRYGIQSDDHAGFDRPGRRSRPRTKDRPDYSVKPIGRVIGIDRGRFACIVEGGEDRVVATKARVLGRKGVIVGDRVYLDGDVSGEAGTLARIVDVVERSSVLRRTADDDDPYERPIVANADQLVIVTALADPPPRTGMIDRILVAGFDAGLEPLLCLTKADLASPDELRAAYEPLGVRVVVIDPEASLAPLQAELAGHTSVLVGHSGVGKSTLVNRLIPQAERQTGHVNAVTGRGRHTSTSAVALELPDRAGWVIDTPGVRSFGLSHVHPASIIEAFPDLAEHTSDCPRGCTHEAGAPGCGLDTAVAAGAVAEARVASYRRMLAHRHDRG